MNRHTGFSRSYTETDGYFSVEDLLNFKKKGEGLVVKLSIARIIWGRNRVNPSV